MAGGYQDGCLAQNGVSLAIKTISPAWAFNSRSDWINGGLLYLKLANYVQLGKINGP